ncbi:22485_t:CDS:1, partial [Rhizophagus irregularis]
RPTRTRVKIKELFGLIGGTLFKENFALRISSKSVKARREDTIEDPSGNTPLDIYQSVDRRNAGAAYEETGLPK